MEKLQEERKEIEKQIAELYRRREEIKQEIANERKSSANRQNYDIVSEAINNPPKEFPKYGTVACQGVEGAYSQAAAYRLFDYPNIMYFKQFDGVFSAIEKGLCEYGVLPIENSTAGSVNKIYDLMRRHKFYIVRSVRVKIDHNLLAKPGVNLSDIKEIVSHEQAINQCGEFLKNLGEVKITYCDNTATAAKMIAESDRNDIGAISSLSCASLYGLDVVKEAVQDRDNNYTRFICISKNIEIYQGAFKNSIMATVKHKQGSLFSVLKIFNEENYNLTKLESRPIETKDFEFMFYFDFEASPYNENYIQSMKKLEAACDTFEYLGSYAEIL